MMKYSFRILSKIKTIFTNCCLAKAFIILPGLLICVKMVNAQAKNNERPNIIIITTDQQSATALSFVMGRYWINTPAMDRLASEGVVFTNAYAANPLCAPSRSSIITGQLPHLTGIEANSDVINFSQEKKANTGWSDKDFRSMGTYFKNAGYQTAYFGKWHINYDPANKEAHGFAITKFTTGEGDDSELPEAVSDFLKGPHQKPFLLFVSFLNPHNVCEWARFQKLPDGDIGAVPYSASLPPMKTNFLPPINESKAMALMRESYHNNRRLFPVGDYNNEDWRRLAWGYYRLIERADSLIGKVLASVEENGLDQNTLILFTSDHGECLGAHGFNQKTVFYEESSKVPFILKYNGKIKPGLNSSLVNTGIDILPTLLDFANIDIPASLPGKSMKKAAEDDVTIKRPYIVSENRMEQGDPVNGILPVVNGRMVRSQRYKYCLYDTLSNREELYDLENDPGETTNIATKDSSYSLLQLDRSYLADFANKYNDYLAKKMLKSLDKK